MSDSPTTSFAVRRATKQDIGELARLFTTLGHPMVEETINSLWEPWSADGNIALVAVETNDAIVGAITLHQMMVLHRSMPVGRITALVVDEHARGKGIGRALVGAAEKILTNVGCGLLEITSNDCLTEAHEFYEYLGYKRTSIRLAKKLASAR